MRRGLDWKDTVVANPTGALLLAAAAAFTPPQTARSETYGVSAACGYNYVPNVVKIDGDVNAPTTLTVSQLAALPGQQTLHITYLNHLGVAQTHSETGPTLWTVLSITAGGIKVPPPTKKEYVGEPCDAGFTVRTSSRLRQPI